MAGIDRMANLDDPRADMPARPRPKAVVAAGPVGMLRAAGTAVPATVLGIPMAPALLLNPDHFDASSGWNQHIPFAFWIAEVHKPSIFVELGTHSGTSYFSFCQAVAALRLPTRCFAVDTWRGDAHAGFYDQTVFAKVDACNEAKYAGFSRLVRSTFEEALPHFLDGSIDLLHIDGLHTYEACRQDFESWLPKLSRRAIVLLHDTNVRERGFGVHRLWVELAARYPHFEFVHEHGLGVLGVGTELDAPVRQLFAAASEPGLTADVRAAFWRLASPVRAAMELGEREIEVSRLAADLAESNAELAHLRLSMGENERRAAGLIAEREARIEALQRGLEESHAKAAKLESMLTDQAAELDAARRTLAETEAQSQAAQGNLHTIRRSTSWRITKPLRWIGKLIGGR
jgi:O-antigen biosynthesis protein